MPGLPAQDRQALSHGYSAEAFCSHWGGRVCSGTRDQESPTRGNGIVARDEVDGILLLAILEVVEVVAHAALDAIIQQAHRVPFAIAREAGFQGTCAGVLPGHIVPMVRPQELELLLHLPRPVPSESLPGQTLLWLWARFISVSSKTTWHP